MAKWISKLRFASICTGVLAISGGNAAADPREAGIWYDDSGKGAVKLAICGDKLCGHIYWLKEPAYPDGRLLVDRHNPNESQRSRAICGLQVIGGLAAMDNGEWDTGWIYDPKEGKSYSVALSLADPDTLKVTGYLVMRIMGRTLTWKRAPDDLPSCVQQAAAAPSNQGQGTGSSARGGPATQAQAASTAKTSAKKPATKAAEREVLPWAEK